MKSKMKIKMKVVGSIACLSMILFYCCPMKLFKLK